MERVTDGPMVRGVQLTVMHFLIQRNTDNGQFPEGGCYGCEEQCVEEETEVGESLLESAP